MIRLDAKQTNHDAVYVLTSALSTRLRTIGPWTRLPPSRHWTSGRPKTVGTAKQDASREQRYNFSYSRTFPPSSTTGSPRNRCIIKIWIAWASSWSRPTLFFFGRNDNDFGKSYIRISFLRRIGLMWDIICFIFHPLKTEKRQANRGRRCSPSRNYQPRPGKFS